MAEPECPHYDPDEWHGDCSSCAEDGIEWLSMEWMRHDGGIHLQELLSLIDSVNFYLTDSKAKDADKQALKRIKKLREFLNHEG